MSSNNKNINVLYYGKSSNIPTYASRGSSGCDLRYSGSSPMVIHPDIIVRIPTNISLIMPEGYEAQIRPKSGITTKNQFIVILGTIDSDYRGTIDVMGYALNSSVVLNPNTKIAQLVFCPIVKANFIKVEEKEYMKNKTERGSHGFGSSL